MKVGVNLINFGPGASPPNLTAWVRLAEDLGYHSILTSDHVATTPDVEERYPAPFYEPLSTLGWMAGITDRIALGTTVSILPYRHPLELARAVANVDQLSGGRMILGVGVGWARTEFDLLGVPFHRRGAMTDEYLEVMRRFWTEDVLSHDGRFVSFRDVRTAPRPLQRPHPPLWIGGSSDAALRRAVVNEAAWHPIRLRTGWLEDAGIPRLQAAADALDRPRPAVCPRIRCHITDAALPDDGRFLGEGSFDQIRGDLDDLQRLGCEHVVLDTFHDDVRATRDPRKAWDAITLVAERILDLGNETVR